VGTQRICRLGIRPTDAQLNGDLEALKPCATLWAMVEYLMVWQRHSGLLEEAAFLSATIFLMGFKQVNPFKQMR